jgi:NADH-quinone oxidoreductase subunit A
VRKQRSGAKRSTRSKTPITKAPTRPAPTTRGVSGAVNVYTPIFVLGALAFGFAAFSVVIASFTGPKRYNRAKYDAYECGIEPTPQPIGGGRFPVKYYLTAMMFIIFDIELVFLYPWAVAFDQLGAFGLVAMMLFLLNLAVPYVYEWRRGGLEWD